ncbi:hypothetical protein D5E78_31495, partial [Vibrio parahaemolyticus]
KLFKKLSFDEYHMDSITHGKGTEYSFNKNGLPPMVSLLVDKISVSSDVCFPCSILKNALWELRWLSASYLKGIT